MIVLDANAVIAFLDPADPHFGSARAVFASGEPLAIPALTLAEVMVHPLPDAGGWDKFVADFDIEIIPLLTTDPAGLAQVRRETRLRMPDAAVLHAAQALKAAIATTDARVAAEARARGLATHPAVP
ncbi:MAG: type II toxin-antitoxin system VapC family toxin [Bifidobacteriaceae bacterium]|nr:type II toxin-antitoxin system VapC family toxin [Bifidobacteriaceae bacterium]